jgi:hypothetical protein
VKIQAQAWLADVLARIAAIANGDGDPINVLPQ